MAAGEQPSDYGGCGCMLLVLGIIVLIVAPTQGWGWVSISFGVLLVLHALIKGARQKRLRQEQARQEQLEQEEEQKQEQLRQEEEHRQEQLKREEDERQQREWWESLQRLAKRAEEERREEAKRAKVERQRQIDELLQRDEVMERVNYMSGPEFERYMAELFRKQGYSVQRTPGSGDQGIDLLVDIDDRKVAVQLKRWTQPVGNGEVLKTIGGMLVYKAQEAWLITTSRFTRSAVEAARGTGVRLVDGDELRDWMKSLIDEPTGAEPTVEVAATEEPDREQSRVEGFDYTEFPDVNPEFVPDREQGRVKWFDPEKGYGFLVRPTGEDLFVHHSEVEGSPFALEPDDEADYVVGYNNRGPYARSVRLIE